MPKYRFLLLFLLLSSSAQAAISSQDYAYEALLEQNDQQLQRVQLPIEIILALTRSDLGDVAVFNVNGKRLPHAVLPAPKGSSEQSLVLPIHEFSRFQQQHSKTVTTREQNKQSNSLSEVEIRETVEVQALHKDYLIELTPQKNTPHFDRLDLQWSHTPADQILQVKVEVGNELDRLRVIQQRKSLTNAESGDQSWRSISGIPRGKKYLRLTAINAVEHFDLQQVSGHYRKADPAPTVTHRIQTREITEEREDYFYFKYPSNVAAGHMRIIPTDSHSVITADIYVSQADFDKRIGMRLNIRQHNIDDPEVVASSPIGMHGRSWNKVWIKSRDELAVPPDVQLIYPQYELLFLGDDQGPYTLAWGNHDSAAPNDDLQNLLGGSPRHARKRAVLVSLGTIQESGGSDRLAAQPALPWQKWLLWSLLILAAIVTGRMALRLYHEMNQDGESEERA